VKDTSASLLMRVRDRQRHPGAWDEFIRLYTPLLLRWAARAGLQHADRIELVQEVFVILLRALPTFEYDERRSFRAWLHTVLQNKWIDLVRRRREQAGVKDVSAVVAPDSHVEIEEHEFRQFLIHRALELAEEDLGPATIAAFRRTALQGQRSAEAAVELGISENAVNLARRRVFRRIKQYLQGMLDD
jgi:RNA polymerase sigma-70 factor, ECF subfamily